MYVHKLVSSVFGIGYVKGGGTIAAFICGALWYILNVDGFEYLVIAVTMLILIAGIWSAGIVEKVWGKDNSKVVIDEVVGMAFSLLFIPNELKYLLAAFVLFRFFDIVKPIYIRKAESLPGGWGVMMDDVQAGIYTNIFLQLILFLTRY